MLIMKCFYKTSVNCHGKADLLNINRFIKLSQKQNLKTLSLAYMCALPASSECLLDNLQIKPYKWTKVRNIICDKDGFKVRICRISIRLYFYEKNCLSESILKNDWLGARIIRILLEPKDPPKKWLNPFAGGASQFKPPYLFTFYEK